MEYGDKVSVSDVSITGEGEINSDPKVVKESIYDESNNINDSGLETTPNLIDENNLTQSVIRSGAQAESTPITSKAKELSVDDLFNFMRTMSSEMRTMSSGMRTMSNDINEKFHI